MIIREEYALRIERAKKAIQEADYIVIGAGAGLSTAAGLNYSGKRFTENFKPFIEKYGMRDLYSSSFYPFGTQEEKWAYWARHISLNRYETPATELYIRLHEFIKTSNYFVITTNVDSQFEKAGFEKERLFEVQGNYAFFQCETACHDKLYYNEQMVTGMLAEIDDCRIPARLVPKCPECGGNMDVNLRKDQYFIQDQNWHIAQNIYHKFLLKALAGTVVFLELGVGFNTPGIIRYPFESMVFSNLDATLLRINKDYPTGVLKNKKSTVSFNEDIHQVLNDLKNQAIKISEKIYLDS